MYQIENAHSYYVSYNQYSVLADKSHYSEDAQAGGTLSSSKSLILAGPRSFLSLALFFNLEIKYESRMNSCKTHLGICICVHRAYRTRISIFAG